MRCLLPKMHWWKKRKHYVYARERAPSPDASIPGKRQMKINRCKGVVFCVFSICGTATRIVDILKKNAALNISRQFRSPFFNGVLFANGILDSKTITETDIFST
ncbi:hypothetical protein AVEN_246338-1 [Araneus ventricosus]|uniref:Uncharacterized protein n=1 Tax=Araneus ventricosus TaxID=182803 RepID=A0A4Y2VBT5_ARAVE|nr:hypothetical protein AVEN_246338-1 [Araneus ventricosus]